MAGTAIRPWLRERAREHRREPTEAERRLWRALRRLNRQGEAHFRRQAPIGGFIVDFADLGRRLVVEVDGGQHAGEADAARDAWLAGEGFLVLRFWNNEVLGNADGVVEIIMQRLAERPDPHPIPPPQGGREPRDGDLGPPSAAGAQGVDLSASPPRCGEGLGVGRRQRRPRRGAAWKEQP